MERLQKEKNLIDILFPIKIIKKKLLYPLLFPLEEAEEEEASLLLPPAELSAPLPPPTDFLLLAEAEARMEGEATEEEEGLPRLKQIFYSFQRGCWATLADLTWPP